MIKPRVGEVHEHPSGLIFVVLGFGLRDDAGGPGVEVLVLQDNPAFTKQVRAGTTFVILRDTGYWTDSVPFSSLPDRGKVSS